MSYPLELEKIQSKGAEMGPFVPILYGIANCFFDWINKQVNILEIGVRWGTSTNALLWGLRNRARNNNQKLYSIDITNCDHVVTNEELRKYWEFIQGKSSEVVWNKKIDILLIDGDHSYNGVKSDYLKYEPFVKENGIILMHDVLWPKKSPIKVFWDEVQYPKSILPLSRSGLGIIYKVMPPYYNNDIVKINNKL